MFIHIVVKDVAVVLVPRELPRWTKHLSGKIGFYQILARYPGRVQVPPAVYDES